MLRLIATSVLLSICFYLGVIQHKNSVETVIAVSMRRADKVISASKQTPSSTLPQGRHSAINADMIFSTDSGQCLTVSGGSLAESPNLSLESCHGGDNQYWYHGTGIGQWHLQRDFNYCLAAVDHQLISGGHLTVRPCTDSRSIMLLPNPSLSHKFLISDTAYVLNSDAYGHVTVAQQNNWSYQNTNWQQDNLEISILAR